VLTLGEKENAAFYQNTSRDCISTKREGKKGKEADLPNLHSGEKKEIVK